MVNETFKKVILPHYPADSGNIWKKNKYRVSTKKGTFTHYHSLVKVPFFVDTL